MPKSAGVTKLPELYVIGAPKAGTTSVAAWLADHPDVYCSVPKEPFYWADDYPRLRAHYGFATRTSYESLFASPSAVTAQVRAEGSTVYLYSSSAVANIRTFVPDARFVVCLRNPVDLLVSYHRNQLVALNEDDPDLGSAWQRSLSGRLPQTSPLDPKLVDYPLVAGLGRALERCMELIPREHLHVIFFDDLRTRQLLVWERLRDFAALGGGYVPDFSPRNPSNKTFRSASLQR